MDHQNNIIVNSVVTLNDETDCIIPAGEYIVTKVNENGSFHVGGNTVIWPKRVINIVNPQ